jgi:hypothetical protein
MAVPQPLAYRTPYNDADTTTCTHLCKIRALGSLVQLIHTGANAQKADHDSRPPRLLFTHRQGSAIVCKVHRPAAHGPRPSVTSPSRGKARGRIMVLTGGGTRSRQRVAGGHKGLASARDDDALQTLHQCLG